MFTLGNEWKTRYETQLDLNGQLERQIAFVHGRLEDLRGNPMGMKPLNIICSKDVVYVNWGANV